MVLKRRTTMSERESRNHLANIKKRLGLRIRFHFSLTQQLVGVTNWSAADNIRARSA